MPMYRQKVVHDHWLDVETSDCVQSFFVRIYSGLMAVSDMDGFFTFTMFASWPTSPSWNLQHFRQLASSSLDWTPHRPVVEPCSVERPCQPNSSAHPPDPIRASSASRPSA